MSKHTPGPWSVDFGEAMYVRAPDGSNVAIAGQLTRSALRDRSESAANARLIAAAPELLEAADEALNVLIVCCIPSGGVFDRDAILNAQKMLRAAITQAGAP